MHILSIAHHILLNIEFYKKSNKTKNSVKMLHSTAYGYKPTPKQFF